MREPKKPTRPRLVRIEWIDSEHTEGWSDVDDLREQFRKHGLDRIISVGYVVDETTKYVLLAGCLQHNWRDEITRGARFLCVPRVCIRGMVRMKE